MRVFARLVAALVVAFASPVAAQELRTLPASELTRVTPLLPEHAGATVERAYRFRDAQGVTVLVLSRRPHRNVADLYLAFLRLENTRYRLLTEHVEPDEDCDDDGYARFSDFPLALSDDDRDGVAEVRLGMLFQCTTDVSPPQVLVRLFEGAVQQASVRGNADGTRPAHSFPSRYTVESAMGPQRARFIQLALRYWVRLAARHAVISP